MTGAAAGGESRAAYYPVYLDLTGRPVVIVGGDATAAGKVRPILEAGADLTVIAPAVEDSIRRWAGEGRLRWLAREFSPGDLRGARLAIDATENGEGNRLVRAEAERERCLLNSVDRTPLCDWIAPALVDRGPLKVAVSTAGESPFLAGAVRRRLEVLLGEEWGPFLRMVGALRRRLRADGVGPLEQERIYRRALRSRARLLLRNGRRDEARDLLDGLRGERAEGRITVVGGGPGSPEHLSLAAVEALQDADLVLHDPDVPAAILSACGARPHRQPAGGDVVDRLRREAGEGADVVWLRPGDGGSGIEDLRGAGYVVRRLPETGG